MTTSIPELDTLFNNAQTAYNNARTARYEAIAQTFRWVILARDNDDYIKAQESQMPKDSTDDWETYWLKEIFKFQAQHHRAQLSKYKTVFGHIEANWTDEDGEFSLPDDKDIIAFIKAKSIAQLSKKTPDVDVDTDYADGVAYLNGRAVRGAVENDGDNKVNKGTSDKSTEYVTMLCRVTDGEVEMLTKVGDITTDWIKAKGKELRKDKENKVDGKVLFWLDLISAVRKVKKRDAVITLQKNGTDFIVSNAYKTDTKISPVFKMTSAHTWSKGGDALNIDAEELFAVGKILKTPDNKRDAKVKVSAKAVTITVGSSKKTISLENAAKDQLALAVKVPPKQSKVVFVIGKGDHVVDAVRETLEKYKVPHMSSENIKKAAKLYPEQEVEITYSKDAIRFDGEAGRVDFPVWQKGKGEYSKDAMSKMTH